MKTLPLLSITLTPCFKQWKSLSHVQLFVTPWTVHGILQARILEWVAFPFFRGSSQPRDRTQVSHIAGGFLTSWATREAHALNSAWYIADAQSRFTGELINNSNALHHLIQTWKNFSTFFTLNSWRRQWHPTPVLLPGKSHEQRSLVGCSPWRREESNMTERLHFHFSLSCIGEGNGNPLQCSCLENPRDGGAWWAAVYGIAQSRTWLKRQQHPQQQSLWWVKYNT